MMSENCEDPIDELTVQVLLLYHHPNFKYCTLFVSRTELWTDRQTNGPTDGWSDDPITRCPRRTFQAGGIKNVFSLMFVHGVHNVNKVHLCFCVYAMKAKLMSRP